MAFKKLILIELLLYTALTPAIQAQWVSGVCIKPYMPDCCIEIAPSEPFATKTPWQLPKPSDKGYRQNAEDAIKKQTGSLQSWWDRVSSYPEITFGDGRLAHGYRIVVRLYRNGVFEQYMVVDARAYQRALQGGHSKRSNQSVKPTTPAQSKVSE